MPDREITTTPAPPRVPVVACCEPAEHETCCEPSKKAACCGQDARTGTCGC